LPRSCGQGRKRGQMAGELWTKGGPTPRCYSVKGLARTEKDSADPEWSDLRQDWPVGVILVHLGSKEPVMHHIQDAESWLSRAKTDYLAANDIRGELDLSLAQAEVRYAWELSRGKTEVAALPRRNRRRGWWLPVAACLGVGLLAAMVIPLVIKKHQEDSVDRRLAPISVRHEEPVPTPATPSVGIPSGNDRVVPAVDKQGTSPGTPPEGPAAPATAPAPVSGATAGGSSAPPNPTEPPIVPPADNLRPVSAYGAPVVDLGELERVAQETLRAGGSATGG